MNQETGVATQKPQTGILAKINSVSGAQLASLPEVAERFKNIYSIMNGGNAERAALKYEAEKFHFMKLIQDKPDLQQCSKLSLYGCFLDMAVNGLSFDPSMKHAYVVSFNTNIGTRDNPKWEKRATLLISGYGELHMRVMQRQIKYADNPVLVYEGDDFKFGTKNGKPYLEHAAAFPRKTDNIIACYVRIERNDGSSDYKVLSIEEVMKLKKFSKDQNSKAWGDGLPGMIQAKTIKHAFRSYPKMRKGDFSTLQSEAVDPDEAVVIPVIDYGLGPVNNTPLPEPNPTATYQPSMVVSAAGVEETNNFDEPNPVTSQGVVYQEDEFSFAN